MHVLQVCPILPTCQPSPLLLLLHQLWPRAQALICVQELPAEIGTALIVLQSDFESSCGLLQPAVTSAETCKGPHHLFQSMPEMVSPLLELLPRCFEDQLPIPE